MPDQVTFKCLRCGNEWRGLLDADLERMCPRCRSNSVRRVKDKETRRPGDKETITITPDK
jgi:DNA-directed RNA polymerase subunit RPC12/RpoP